MGRLTSGLLLDGCGLGAVDVKCMFQQTCCAAINTARSRFGEADTQKVRNRFFMLRYTNADCRRYIQYGRGRGANCANCRRYTEWKVRRLPSPLQITRIPLAIGRAADEDDESVAFLMVSDQNCAKSKNVFTDDDTHSMILRTE